MNAMKNIVSITTTLHGNTRTRIYNADCLTVKAGDPVLVCTKAGDILLGSAASDSDQITEREEAMLRKYLGIGEGDFLPVLEVLPYTREKILSFLKEEPETLEANTENVEIVEG